MCFLGTVDIFWEKREKNLLVLWNLEQKSTWFDARSVRSNLAEIVPSWETHSDGIHTVHKYIINITRSTCLKKIKKTIISLLIMFNNWLLTPGSRCVRNSFTSVLWSTFDLILGQRVIQFFFLLLTHHVRSHQIK